MTNVVIFGASSAIAQASARLLAQRGYTLLLVARDSHKLEAIAADLNLHGAKDVICVQQDLAHIENYDSFIQTLNDKLTGNIDITLLAHGTLDDQAKLQQSCSKTFESLHLNALSYIGLLTVLANQMETKRAGTLIAISSVAGDRGRQSNYVYGSAKGLVSLFCQGLRNRLDKAGVQVITIKPGFVDTPMTAAFPKGALWAQPETIAQGIIKALDKKRNTVYLPSFWRLIMFVITHIPEKIFKKLSL